MHRRYAETNPQHTLPGSAVCTLGISERVDSKPTTGRRA
jgi:hypothetical protein